MIACKAILPGWEVKGSSNLEGEFTAMSTPPPRDYHFVNLSGRTSLS